ncbi:MAG: hypothetical protein R8N23_07350 [Reichenbachiella sp.]|nr:hypothetical protein [Reichenbachiella sp.]MDW3209664.1 hypothetical protein [Reichenbachiella sp.]
MATNSPRFQNIHPNVVPVIKFPIMDTPIVNGVSSTKFLDNGKCMSPKNNAEIIIPVHTIFFDGKSDALKNWIPVMIKDINPSLKIISSVIPAEKETSA